jgi:starch synthase
MGLQGALQARGADLVGVLNGIDATEWSPSSDRFLTVPYDASTIEKKEINKQALLTEYGVPVDDPSRTIPLVGMVTRLTEQKGITLLQDCLEAFIAAGSMRLVMLGSGERRFEEFFMYLQERYGHRAIIGTGYNNALSHKIQAASDFYLMPSKFEPCGLTQMYALAYGTIPIVRATGGLADTIHHYDPVTFSGNGIRFYRYTADDCRTAISEALRLYQQEPHWSRIRANAMASDHSAAVSAARYIDVFGWAKDVHASH